MSDIIYRFRYTLRHFLFTLLILVSILWVLLALNAVERSLVLAVWCFTIMNFLSMLDISMYSSKLMGMLLSRFETQFIIVNALFVLVFLAFVHTDLLLRIVVVGGSTIPIAWNCFLDASSVTTKLRTNFTRATSLCSIELLTMTLIISQPGQEGVQQLIIKYTTFGTTRQIDLHTLFFTFVVNILIVEIKYFFSLNLHPERLVTIKSSMATAKVDLQRSRRVIRHAESSHNRKKGHKNRAVLHVTAPFTYKTGETLAFVAFGTRAGRFFLGKGGRLLSYVQYIINIPMLFLLLFRLFNSQVNTRWDYGILASSLLLGSPGSMVNLVAVLVPRIFENFEASFLTFNIMFLIIGMTLMLRGGTSVVLPLGLLPLFVSGIFVDAHVVRKTGARLRHEFVIFSVLMVLLLGFFFGFFNIEDLDFHLGSFKFSLRNRCVGCLTNALFISCRMMVKTLFYPNEFVFIKCQLKSSRIDDGTLAILCGDLERLLV